MDDTTVLAATGRPLGDWFAILDGRGARDLAHKSKLPARDDSDCWKAFWRRYPPRSEGGREPKEARDGR